MAGHDKTLYVKSTCTAFAKNAGSERQQLYATSAAYAAGKVPTHGMVQGAGISGAVQSAHQDALAKVQQQAHEKNLTIRYVEYADNQFTAN